MNGYDYERPFIGLDKLDEYIAVDGETARRYGRIVKATRRF